MKKNNWSMRLLAVLGPLVALYLIAIPYAWLNGNVIAQWLGCECPDMDGNLIESAFNANDFAACFWLGMGILDTVVVFALAKGLYENVVLRWTYRVVEMVIIGIVCVTLYQGMMLR